MDLEDLEHNTRDGIHIASVAGTWVAAVCGFGGLRSFGGELHLSPRLPPELTRLKFRLMYRGCFLHVEVDAEHARYSLVDGRSLDIRHHGERLTIEPDQAVEKSIPRLPARPAPSQPQGRAPARRRPPAHPSAFDRNGQG
jgi:alpha,alpha-trehalose phosphorylase